MKYFVVALILCLVSLDTRAQQGDTTLGWIRGKVVDRKTKNPLDFAIVQLESNKKIIAEVMTDDTGGYVLKSVQPGEYELIVTYVGYRKSIIKEMVVRGGWISIQDIAMEANGKSDLSQPIIFRCGMRWTLIDPEGKSGKKFTSRDIQRLPY